MAAQKHELTTSDILSMAEYGKIRVERRKAVVERKKYRRLEVGPHATFYFENFETMWFQVHEMLWIEKGGAEQIADELRAYNPLIPKGRELVATIMFEIPDINERRAVLGKLGGVEDHFELRLGTHVVKGVPEADVDRTSADGKASSVQFAHFPFTAEQIMAFRQPHTDIIAAICHPAYNHKSVMPEAMRQALLQDFA